VISVVVPVFNEEASVAELHSRLLEALRRDGRPFEVLFVDDGSTDGTFAALKGLQPVRIIRFKKNFGQTLAMDAGLQAARGDVVVTMDGDLQNDPDDIPKLLAKLEEGYDVVSGWRADRSDSFGRRLLSRLANRLTGAVTGLRLHDHACAIKAYRKKVFEGVHLYGEMHVFLPAYLHGRGAKVAEIPVRHFPRRSGSSKHHLFKAVQDLSDLVTVRFLSRHMDRPLLFFGGGSLAMGTLGALAAAAAAVLKIMGLRNFGQTPLPILSVFFGLIGFLLFMMGFLGELILRVYFETQNKPPYLIGEVIENP